ncbi:Calx-beta domain-containing protein [Mycolicibacterium tokaiense]|uniref:Calx-beta domain-containing protein n=1 Tax=Mycolicibacterium tokaiense TaxID=39695 RepID=UPI00138CF590|nr:Calx-beta domain-containing protein [Mycolicibacterium tokaiense]BBY85979.1 hypothetical protein MTOK_17610 [Mycolicibacterium tokaiense]
MAGKHRAKNRASKASVSTKRNRRIGQERGSVTWLGAGAVTLGIGAALACGATGTAHANSDTDSGQSTRTGSETASGTTPAPASSEKPDSKVASSDTTPTRSSQHDSPESSETEDTQDDTDSTSTDLEDLDDDSDYQQEKESDSPDEDPYMVGDEDDSETRHEDEPDLAETDVSAPALPVDQINKDAPESETLSTAASVNNSSESDKPSRAVTAQPGPPSFQQIIEYTFFNKAPKADPQQAPGQSELGVVTGNLNVTASNGATLTYKVSDQPSKGTVEISGDGTYTFTPDADLAALGGSDIATVTIDAGSRFRLTGIAGAIQGVLHSLAMSFGLAQRDTITVTVPLTVAAIGPDPVITGYTASEPGAGGVVTGTVSASDPNGDTLTFSGPGTSSGGGIVTVNEDGSFSYKPTSEQRHGASALDASAGAKVDGFVVTVSDGNGNTATTTVKVAISPANGVPAIESATVGVPNESTGTVTGVVTATDPDGDALEFRGSTTTDKGILTVAADGTFTYTPTAAARDKAAQAGSTDADLMDIVSVTVVDGHGGTSSVPLSIPISPKAIVVITVAFDGSVYSIDEGNSGITTTPVRVKLSEASTETITVTYKVERAYLTNSATAGTDFIEETGTLTFTPGQTIATLPVQVYGDTTYEDNEYIHIELTGATGAILSLDGSTSAYPTIRNDDAPNAITVSFDGSVYSIDEGNSGITTTPVRVKLSEASTETITVTYKVERAYLTNSATAGTDFIEETGTLTFTPGQTIATLPVQVYGDTTYEDNEYIHIELTGATGAILSLDASTSAYPTIRNDDAPNATTVSFDGSVYSIDEGNSGITTTPVRVKLSEASTETITVTYKVERAYLTNSATAGTDFIEETGTLTFTPVKPSPRCPSRSTATPPTKTTSTSTSSSPAPPEPSSASTAAPPHIPPSETTTHPTPTRPP